MHRIVQSACTLGALAIVALVPAGVQASSSHVQSAHTPKITHHLPKGAPTATVFSFGVQGGSLRPWSVTIALDGTVSANGVSATVTKLASPTDTLNGLLALADAEGFFAMSKQIGCSGSGGADTSSHTIAVFTSTGKRKVSVFGTCKAPFNQLYAILQQIVGTTR